MGTERIETLISKEALEQFDTLNAKLALSVTGFEKLISKGVEINKALGGAKTFKEVNEGTKELTANEKALTAQIAELTKQQAKLHTLYNEEAAKIAKIKVEQQQRNAALKQEVQLNQAAEGSIRQKQIQLKSLTDQYDKLSAAQRVGAEGQALLKSVTALDKELKGLEGTTGRFQRNVGNYSGAVKVLEGALRDVNKKLDDFGKAGKQDADVIDSLIKEQQLLQTLVDGQSNGFKNATSEIRNNSQAILQLSQVYGEDSEIVRALQADTAKLQDTVGDLRASIKAQASDTRVFDGLISAAQGLTGVYTIAQGATALFGVENEELQQTFVKLQAAMAILQGLQAIQNVIQKESAARQLVNIGLKRIEVIQTNLATAAESKNIVVRYAAAAAQRVLNTVMMANPILLIVGLLGLLTIALTSFSFATKKAEKSFEELNQDFEINAKRINESISSIRAAEENIIADLEKNFADERTIREKRLEFGEKEVALRAKQVEDARGKAEEALQYQKEVALGLRGLDEEQLKQRQEYIDKYTDAQDKFYAAQDKQGRDQLANQKAIVEEAAKIEQSSIEVQKIQIGTRLSVLRDIIGDETKTYDQRLGALSAFNAKQNELINAEASQQLKTPGLSASQIKVIEANRSAAILTARRETDKQIDDLNKQRVQREHKAQFDIATTSIQIQQAAAQEIVENENASLEDRLFAAYEYQQAQIALIEGQKNLELQNETLTETERKAITDKANADRLAAKKEFVEKSKGITISSLTEENRIALANANIERDAALTALNEKFAAGKISIAQYNKERLELSKKFAQAEIDVEIDALLVILAARKAAGEDVSEQEAAIQALRLKASQITTDQLISDEERLAGLRKQLAEESVALLQTVILASFDRQKNAVQDQINLLEIQKQKDIEVANASIQNAAMKADTIAVINARAAAQKEALERKQRQIDIERARFEKAVSIARIVADTAIAIVNQFKQPGGFVANAPFAALIAAIGAVQLAKAISTPIPRFAEGTLDAPGGPSLVGDAYRSEMIVTPDGRLIQTPNVPTVMNVPKHSLVLPDARAVLESGIAREVGGIRSLVDHGKYYKEMTSKLGGKIDDLINVVRNKKETHINGSQGSVQALLKWGANQIKYIEDQTNF